MSGITSNKKQREISLLSRLSVQHKIEDSLEVNFTPMSADPYFPQIEVQLTGNDSNAGTIMGLVSDALRRHHVPSEAINLYRDISMSGSYDELLQTAMRWVAVS